MTASVTLCWDPSTDSDVTQYCMYYGGASRNYTNQTVNVTSAFTNATITGLTEGATYYFAATAKDSLGLESDFSNEVVYTVPTNNITTNVVPPVLSVQKTTTP